MLDSHGSICLLTRTKAILIAYKFFSLLLIPVLFQILGLPLSLSREFVKFGNLRNETSAAPLHLAASQGWSDCLYSLLDNGAFVCASTGRDGKTRYHIALKFKHETCSALLNPASPEPLVWPYPLRFISELYPETKSLLQAALMEANKDIF